VPLQQRHGQLIIRSYSAALLHCELRSKAEKLRITQGRTRVCTLMAVIPFVAQGSTQCRQLKEKIKKTIGKRFKSIILESYKKMILNEKSNGRCKCSNNK
jgi:hypothetical protein